MSRLGKAIKTATHVGLEATYLIVIWDLVLPRPGVIYPVVNWVMERITSHAIPGTRWVNGRLMHGSEPVWGNDGKPITKDDRCEDGSPW
jgi:hypothetical protein